MRFDEPVMNVMAGLPESAIWEEMRRYLNQECATPIAAPSYPPTGAPPC